MRAPGTGLASWVAGRAALWGFASALLGGWACGGGAGPRSVASPQPALGAVPHVLSSYHAPLGCPTEREYLSEIASRSATLQLVPESAGVHSSDRLRVRIQPDTSSAGWVGALQIEGAHPLEREVRGERCQDVALALALITVLRLERDAASPAADALAAPTRT